MNALKIRWAVLSNMEVFGKLGMRPERDRRIKDAWSVHIFMQGMRRWEVNLKTLIIWKVRTQKHKDTKIQVSWCCSYIFVAPSELQTSLTCRGLLVPFAKAFGFWSDRSKRSDRCCLHLILPSNSASRNLPKNFQKSPAFCSCQVTFSQSMQPLGVMHYGILPKAASQNARASGILGPHMRDGKGVGWNSLIRTSGGWPCWQCGFRRFPQAYAQRVI